MEDLIELVAASLARHGIECPAAGDSSLVWRRSIPTLQTSTQPSAEPTALLEHSYRKISQGDPAP
jgi:hypothetical protein